jgi:hypothetical protein
VRLCVSRVREAVAAVGLQGSTVRLLMEVPCCESWEGILCHRNAPAPSCTRMMGAVVEG